MTTLLQGQRFLSSVRFKTIVRTLASSLEIERPLIALKRIPLVDAFEDELVGRFTAKILAAALVADDQAAPVDDQGKVEVVTHAIPNVKIGQRLDQRKLNMLEKLRAMGQGMAMEENAFLAWENDLANNIVLGVRQQMNAMAYGMLLDSFSYDRFGIKLTNATWGMPSAFKVTVGTAWSNAGSATPIDDILAINQAARDAYGVQFDRLTIGSPDLRLLVATTDFKTKVQWIAGLHFAPAAAGIPTKLDDSMRQMLGMLLGFEVEIDDGKYFYRNNDGSMVTTRYLPTGKVLLTRKQDDNDRRVWDFANAPVTESIVDALTGGRHGLGSSTRGPLGYYTEASPNLNPPGAIAWGVARCFPRKHVPELSAVLTVA